MEVRIVEGSLDTLRRLNLPAVLACYLEGDQQPRYLALRWMDEGRCVLLTPRERVDTSVADLERYYAGVAYVPWKNYMALKGTIPGEGRDPAVLALKMLLRELGYPHLRLSPEYDLDTQNAIRTIQSRNGLTVDGVVGSSTKIVIYQEVGRWSMPLLNAPPDGKRAS
jgi:hypothetical protein